MIANPVCTDLAQKSGEGVSCPCVNAHSTSLALCRYFTAFAELLSLVFLVVSFPGSLSLEESVKVLKVGL